MIVHVFVCVLGAVMHVLFMFMVVITAPNTFLHTKHALHESAPASLLLVSLKAFMDFGGESFTSFNLQARSWRKVIQVNMELTEVRRQTDQNFISLLQAVRVGR